MIEIPRHLKDCTKIKKISEDTIHLQVLCKWCWKNFNLLENLLDFEEENIIKVYEKRLSRWRSMENYIDQSLKLDI